MTAPCSDLVVTCDTLMDRARDLRSRRGRRVVIGIVGAPGAGKSTLAEALVAGMTDATLLPMDGFHLSQRQLQLLGRAERKGAPDTFDTDGYIALLARVHARAGDVLAPGFVREIEEPIAAMLRIPDSADIVFTEGNYLLHDGDGWEGASDLLDEVWFLTPHDAVRRGWLVQRHRRFGRTEEDALEWVASVDEPNAALIRRGLDRADLVITGWVTPHEDAPAPTR